MRKMVMNPPTNYTNYRITLHSILQITPTSKRIYGYRSSEPLPVIGKFEAEIMSGVTSKLTVTQFCVVDGRNGNLISYETATDLRLLHVMSTPKVDNIIEDYNDCFEELGKMKGRTANLHANDSTKPLAQNRLPFRLPFHIRDQVEAELKNLEKLDIIEELKVQLPGSL